MAFRNPLLSFSSEQLPLPNLERSRQSTGSNSNSSDDQPRKKLWYHYLPLYGVVLLILAPHPSLLYVLVTYHIQILHSPLFFVIHLLVTYTLTFLAFSSLIVCLIRDPGPITDTKRSEDEETSLQEALMSDDHFNDPGRWCRKCWAPKPERTHHCSTCGRCVLKMDHHCPWLGNNCIGHRTYPAFLHFLLSVTLLAIYVAIMSISALIYAFDNPYAMDFNTPIHGLFLAALGIIFSVVIGPFFGYHVYLVSTNQTTIENISPFLLLKHLPKLPRGGHDLSDPPLEPELSGLHRRLVKDAHQSIHLYDVGWRANWTQVLGCERQSGWAIRLWCGGASSGDGRYFPRNPKAENMLARLAIGLVKIDRDNNDLQNDRQVPNSDIYLSQT